MHYLLRTSLTWTLLLSTSFTVLFSQNESNHWKVSKKSIESLRAAAPMKTLPLKYKMFKLEGIQNLDATLQTAPLRFSAVANQPENTVTIHLPFPDGSTQLFKVMNSPIMPRALAQKFPEIHTYTAVGLDDPGAVAKIDITPQGFHAMILSAGKNPVYVDPLSVSQQQYLSYYQKDFPAKIENFTCGLDDTASEVYNPGATQRAPVGDCQLRNYRLALACTGEYTVYHRDLNGSTGDGKPDAMAAMVTSMNRINGVFEKDAGITMTMVANNDQLIFTNGLTDPYTNGSSATMLNQNQTTCDNTIGSLNYDIGHVFGTGSGGIASLRSPCSGSKARGVTELNNPINDPFDINYVAHEIGHQFGGNHTQNNNCNRSNASIEPGSGSTIMGYAGICSPNVQQDSDAYFHGFSLDEFASFVTTNPQFGGGDCAAIASSANNTPVVDAGSNYLIPVSTPFELTAIASDPDSDPLTYCWEQMDNDPAPMPPASTNSVGPAFRSYTPVPSAVRTFPRLTDLLAGVDDDWEELPSVSRVMNFTVSVRDNNGGYGCVAQDEMTVTTSAAAGPFVMTYPDATETWVAGENRTLTWDVAGTNVAPVSCSQVDILMSTDGGFTFPTTVASNEVNDGSYDYTVPNIESGEVRFKIICSNNIFFTLSSENVIIGLEQTCITVTSTDIPLDISASGSPTIVSDLPVNLGGKTIASVRVLNLNGEHTFTRDLDFTLIHPSGTRVTLLTRECGDDDDFQLSFEDGAAASSCPLSTPQTVNPDAPLSSLNGLTTDGTWQLEIADNADIDGGRLTGWGLELCYLESASVLPVSLTTFTARPVSSAIQLDWRTESERNNEGFELQRKTDEETDFTTIQWISGGGTNDGQTYAHLDTKVKSGVQYYYRLRQVDYDNRFEFSKIVAAQLPQTDIGVDIQPNPVQAELFVSLNQAGTHLVTVKLLDLLGRPYFENKIEVTDYSEQILDMSRLATGVYLVVIEMETGKQIVKRVVKK